MGGNPSKDSMVQPMKSPFETELRKEEWIFVLSVLVKH